MAKDDTRGSLSRRRARGRVCMLGRMKNRATTIVRATTFLAALAPAAVAAAQEAGGGSTHSMDDLLFGVD